MDIFSPYKLNPRKAGFFEGGPSQTKDEFENFIKNFEFNLEHIAKKANS